MMAKQSAMGVGKRLGATSLLPESQDVRFVDAGITAGVAAASVLWTATRSTVASRLGWGLALTALGGLAAVEGRGELRYGGFGVLAANASYLMLELAKPVMQSTQQQP